MKKTIKKAMERILYLILATLFFAPYLGAYLLAHALKLKDRENMPTIPEWFSLAFE